MKSVMRMLIISCLIALLAGCTSKPVRHLASDASLIKPGVSSKDDVLTFLGDPDAQQVIGDDAERWVYYEEKQSTYGKVPYVGNWIGAKGHSQIMITFEGKTVTDVRYSSFASDEFDWSDDYSWQE